MQVCLHAFVSRVFVCVECAHTVRCSRGGLDVSLSLSYTRSLTHYHAGHELVAFGAGPRLVIARRDAQLSIVQVCMHAWISVPCEVGEGAGLLRLFFRWRSHRKYTPDCEITVCCPFFLALGCQSNTTCRQLICLSLAVCAIGVCRASSRNYCCFLE